MEDKYKYQSNEQLLVDLTDFRAYQKIKGNSIKPIAFKINMSYEDFTKFKSEINKKIFRFKRQRVGSNLISLQVIDKFDLIINIIYE